MPSGKPARPATSLLFINKMTDHRQTTYPQIHSRTTELPYCIAKELDIYMHNVRIISNMKIFKWQIAYTPNTRISTV